MCRTLSQALGGLGSPTCHNGLGDQKTTTLSSDLTLYVSSFLTVEVFLCTNSCFHSNPCAAGIKPDLYDSGVLVNTTQFLS